MMKQSDVIHRELEDKIIIINEIGEVRCKWLPPRKEIQSAH